MGANRNVAAAIILLTLAGVGRTALCREVVTEAVTSEAAATETPKAASDSNAPDATEPGAPFAEALAKARKAFADADGEQRAVLARSNLRATLLRGAELAVSENDLSAARDHYREAFALSTRLSAPETQAIVTRMSQLQERFEQADRISRLKKSLAANPQDIDTRRRLIELLIAEADDPAAAAELLTDVVDQSVRRAARALTHPLAERSAEQCLVTAAWLATLDTGLTDSAKQRIALARLECLQRFVMVRRAGEGDLAAAVADIESLVAAQTDRSLSGQLLPAGRWADLTRASVTEPILAARRDERWLNRTFPGEPRRSYTLFLRVHVIDDESSLFCFLPSGGKVYRLGLNARIGSKRLDTLTGKTIGPTAIAAGAVHTITVTVRRAAQLESISLELDGLPYAARLGPSCRPVANPQRGLSLLTTGPVEFLSVLIMSDDAPADPPARTTSQWPIDRRLDIRASKSWQWVAQVSKGDILHITAEGTWSWNGRDECGPAGDASGWYALRGRLVNQDVTVPLGSPRTLVVTEDDILRMEMEDTDKSDNTGAVTVTIRRFRPTTAEPQAQTQDPQADDQP